MYRESSELEEIAEALIDRADSLYHIVEHDYSIGYFYADIERKRNGRMVLGECIKPSGLLTYYCDYDFIITIYEPNIEYLLFDEAQIEILLHHELLHIDYDGDLKGHDIEEHGEILDTYGMYWSIRNA